MLTDLQKAAAQAIVNVFETSRARGDYAQVTVLRGDTGHLTYGRAQTTLGSGNLHNLVKAYCEAPDAAFAGELRPYLEPLAEKDTSLDHDGELHHILREAGGDPVMCETQDAFFDRVYWAPAMRSAEHVGLATALGRAVVYDSRIHGSWHRMRDRTIDRHGTPAAMGEQVWVQAYVDTRRDWLANHSNTLLNKTVYRMDAFKGLFAEDRWDLALPFTVRGVTIDEAVLTSPVTVRASAGDEGERTLLLRRPFMKGEDVREVQQALKDQGLEVGVDGVFGPNTEAAVTRFQSREGLTVDGIVGPATRAALGLD